MADHHSRHAASPESSHHSDDESGGHYGGGHDLSIREQDRLLPIANVSRIMKRALPANAKISKEAKETVQECVSEFISFITGEASDKCQREKRKTVNGDDLLWAMSTLGFEDYIEPLKVYLQRYREMEGEKVSMAKQGDQMVAREGSSGSMPCATLGVNGNLNGGGIPGTMQMMQQTYGQQPGPLIYGQHQLLAPYPTSLPSGTGGNGGHYQGS